MIVGDEHGSFRITTVASNEVGTTGSRRAMKLGPDAGSRTHARRHASPGSKVRALTPTVRRCAPAKNTASPLSIASKTRFLEESHVKTRGLQHAHGITRRASY